MSDAKARALELLLDTDSETGQAIALVASGLQMGLARIIVRLEQRGLVGPGELVDEFGSMASFFGCSSDPQHLAMSAFMRGMVDTLEQCRRFPPPPAAAPGRPSLRVVSGDGPDGAA